MKRRFHFLFILLSLSFFVGCSTSRTFQEQQIYSFYFPEPQWIRSGEPIEFEGELWYPQDGAEGLLDSEVLLMGEYYGVEFFIDLLDVRPFNRLYTKFGRHQFRYFEKREAE